MRRLLLTLSLLFVGGFAVAQDKKGTSVELAGMKSTTPAEWKEEAPSNNMRMAQFKLLKAEGDKEDAELAVFVFPGGSGTVKANLDRQLAKFVEEGRKDKVEQIKIGTLDASYQDVNGTFKKKKFPMDPNFTPAEGFRQLYVVFEAKDGKQYYMTLLGPKATVEKHKKGFDTFLKNFK